MATQNWLSTDPPVSDTDSPPPNRGYDLRPLSVGEILDRVFSLYRGHFWFFAGLSAASAGVSAILGILRLVYMHYSGFAVTSTSHAVIIGGIGILQAALYLIAYSLTLAATTFAVNAFYLGRPTSLGVVLTAARGTSGCAASASRSGKRGARCGPSLCCFCQSCWFRAFEVRLPVSQSASFSSSAFWQPSSME